ncbi:MAG: trehalose-phosphatase [Candidatus Omnitrophica bacterium]|nr:trehalose-phosphatase [Candidatus Omnitrophota bacterium]
MRYLFDWLDKLKKELNNKNIILFLDYDGTLTPIAQTPKKAMLSLETKELLRRLIKNRRFQLAIISGRALKDIKEKIGIEEIIYVGNHGLEIEGPKIKFRYVVPTKYKRIFKNIKNKLKTHLSTIKGAFIEDKGLSFSLHYRLVKKNKIPKVKKILHPIVSAYKKDDKIKIKKAKKAFEITPPLLWNKGKAVLWLLNKLSSAFTKKEIVPIYLGDDVTDEDAFCALQNRGITIFVGKPKKSEAQYYLKNTQQVKDFLNNIIKLQ